MYKKILIISDNSYLCDNFFDIIQRKKINSKFTFSTSPFSRKEEFFIKKNIQVQTFDLKNTDDINQILENFDLIFSIHCKQIFPKELVNNVKCINIHPGYNPINRGWFPQVFSIIYDLPIGATIHEIDELLDNGNIIAREFVKKEIYDTSETLYNKIIAKELELLELNIENIINNQYVSFKPEDEENLFLKKDFNEQLQLNLNEYTTIGAIINKLRALTHGEYNNAFFIDPKTNKKIYIGIKLKLESDE